MDLPEKLRFFCELYDIDVSGPADDDLRDKLNWHNVKLDRDGTIECYTDNELVSKNLDIVLEFAADGKLMSASFDG